MSMHRDRYTFPFVFNVVPADRSIIITLGVVPVPALIEWVELMVAGGTWDVGLGAVFSRLPERGPLVGRVEAEGELIISGATGGLGGGPWNRLRVAQSDASSLYPIGAEVAWGPWWLRLSAYREAGASGLLRGVVSVQAREAMDWHGLGVSRPERVWSRSMMRGRLDDGRRGGVL